MILAECPRCGRRELRGNRGIHPVDTPQGPRLALTCRGCLAELSVATNAVLDAQPTHAVAC